MLPHLPIDGRVLQGSRPPSPVDVASPRVYDARLRDVLPPEAARLLSLYDGASWAEGPVWWERGRMLVFSDVVARRTLGRREDGSVVAVVDPSAFANGNAVDAEGRLQHAEHGRRALSRSNDRGTHVLVDSFEGTPLNSPNDLVVDRAGAVWFTDPLYGITNPREGYPAAPASDHQSVYRWREGQPLQRMLDLDSPNGLAFSPDEATLYIAESNAEGLPRIAACTWDGENLGAPSTFATVDAVIVDDSGARWGVIPTPHIVSNCAFDATEQRLFLTGDADLWMAEPR